MNTIEENIIVSPKTTEDVSSVIKRLGNPISTILLNAPCNIFSISNLDGLIGYQLIGNCAVVMGDPVCLSPNISELTHAFHLFCNERNWSIVYLMASKAFSDWAIKDLCQISIQVGEELILDPTSFQKKQKLRWKIKQSIQQGVIVDEYINDDPALEIQMKEAINTWQQSKQGMQVYLGTLDLLPKDADNRIFYAAQEKKIVGLLALTRIDQFDGWVIKSFLALPEAPVGVTEHLMTTTFETLAKENCHFVCLGAVSGSKLGKIEGLNIFRRFLTHLIYGVSRRFFPIDSRKIYFNKYHPSICPMYLLSNGKLGIKELFALKKIINH